MFDISILVPVFNEEKFLENFFDSLLKQSTEEYLIEIIFIDGNSQDLTMEKLKKIKEKINSKKDLWEIKILTNKKKLIASSLNLGLKESSGTYILRLDVHSELSNSYIIDVITLLKENSSNYCNVGGKTIAKGYDQNSRIFAKALSSKWVLGGAQFRYSNKLVEVDTLFPGAWLREDLNAVKGWNEEWVVNEDTELNSRLKNVTKKNILMNPQITINYFPRNKYNDLIVQYFRYGYWRMKTANAHKNSIRMSHLLPLGTLFYLFLIIVIGLIDFKLLLLFLMTTIIVYSFYLFILSIAIYKNLKETFKGILSIVAIQLPWIAGSLRGYLDFGFPIKGYYFLIEKMIRNLKGI
ncbi:glycosyltransferase [Planococcus chinensis]|uniref:Glycosyltransferase n=1 Tax=Planococcus chinensis TaxID=272917 RepID=A0ABW4QEH9_9BACL